MFCDEQRIHPLPVGKKLFQVLSYNLFWWHLFKVEGGRGGSAGHLIRSTSQPPYDVMGFQECEDPEKVLGPAGLLQDLGFSPWTGKV